MTDTCSSTTEVLRLEARNISKSFPGVQALSDAQLSVRAGRVTALLGENGAGKSTLMNILSGVFPPDTGEIRLDGDLAQFRNPREAQDAGIAIIFQELNLAPNLTVAENIYLGREPTSRLGLIDYPRMHRDAAELLQRLGLPISPQARAEQLSVASQQVVEIARAVSFESRVLILDEPTSALTQQEVASLFQLLDQLKSQQVGIVYITHRLEELERIADDVTVFRDGQFVASKCFHQTNQDELVQLMVGRDVSYEATANRSSVGEVALQVEGLSVASPIAGHAPLVDEVSFEVRRGEIVGMFGLMGAGRTEILQSLFGLCPDRTTGSVKIDGLAQSIGSPHDAITAGLALVPEDRKSEGVVLEMSVANNITLANLSSVSSWGLIRASREQQLAADFGERLAIKTSSGSQAVQDLSGGNQQKVVLAKWLATHPRILLLDEPTRGIDVGAKQEIYRLIRELASAGLAVVCVSSEMPEVVALSDRILVLSQGKLTRTFLSAEAEEDALLRAALPESPAAEVA